MNRDRTLSTIMLLSSVARGSRSRSYELMEMADQRQGEADMPANALGPGPSVVERQGRRAEEPRAVAQEGDPQARSRPRDVAHGMV